MFLSTTKTKAVNKEHRKFFEVVGVFGTLIVEVVSQVFAVSKHIKMHAIVYPSFCILSFVHFNKMYDSVKLMAPDHRHPVGLEHE